MWTTTGGVEMMSNCIFYEKMHDFVKTFKNRGSDGQNSFSAHPTFSQKAPPGEIVTVIITYLGNQKYGKHVINHFGMQYEYIAAILGSQGRFIFRLPLNVEKRPRFREKRFFQYLRF